LTIPQDDPIPEGSECIEDSMSTNEHWEWELGDSRMVRDIGWTPANARRLPFKRHFGSTAGHWCPVSENRHAQAVNMAHWTSEVGWRWRARFELNIRERFTISWPAGSVSGCGWARTQGCPAPSGWLRLAGMTNWQA
jgi:hypothetical protein